MVSFSWHLMIYKWLICIHSFHDIDWSFIEITEICVVIQSDLYCDSYIIYETYSLFSGSVGFFVRMVNNDQLVVIVDGKPRIGTLPTTGRQGVSEPFSNQQ